MSYSAIAYVRLKWRAFRIVEPALGPTIRPRCITRFSSLRRGNGMFRANSRQCLREHTMPKFTKATSSSFGVLVASR